MPTSEDVALRLAAAVFEAEIAAEAAAAPAPAAGAPAAPEAPDAAYAAAVECVLKARAELEVRQLRRRGVSLAPADALSGVNPRAATQPLLDIIAHLESNEYLSIVEVQRPRCARRETRRQRVPRCARLSVSAVPSAAQR